MNQNKLYQKSLQAIFAILVLTIALFSRNKGILEKTEEALKENNKIQNQASILNQFENSSTTEENKKPLR